MLNPALARASSAFAIAHTSCRSRGACDKETGDDETIDMRLAYCHLAAANKNLRRALFERQMASEKPVPNWFV